ncbi:MAG: RIP metalloprotease RseP [Pseudomonadales bacterium]
MAFLQYPLALILTLGILVTIHEFGHFIIARWSGVRVVRFSVGFGRPLWSWTDRRGTEFVLAMIPLGGYVRMLDEREFEEPADGTESAVNNGARASLNSELTGELAHNQLSPLWRIAISFGGPLANFLLAVFVYWWMFLAGSTSIAPLVNEPIAESAAAVAGMRPATEIIAVDGAATANWQQVSVALASRLGETGVIELTTDRPGLNRPQTLRLAVQDWQRGVDEPDLLGSLGIVPKHPAVLGMVMPDSAAQRAGLQDNDWVRSVNGETIAGWSEWVQAIQGAPGQPLQIVVERGGRELGLTVTPDSSAPDAQSGAEARGYLGVGMSTREVRYGPLAAVGQAIDETADKTLLTLSLLKKMVFGQVSMKNLSGPITIAEVAGDSARMGLTYFLGVLALLSISLGVLNLLPIPILDGGHIMFAAAELVSGRPVPERIQLMGMQVGLFLVGGLMIMALYNDFTRLLQ